ncbi:MAG: TspO/MBR family protein [archaeon]
MDWKKILKVLSAIGFCQIAGIVGAFFTTPAITTWYASLAKPSFAPPNWLFGPVWITLYTLMGISLYLVWEAKDSREKKTAIGVFGAQLFLNALWSFLFFGLELPAAGFIGIIFLWVFIFINIILFYKVSKNAAYLLVPYVVWVTIAAYLNYMIMVLNAIGIPELM